MVSILSEKNYMLALLLLVFIMSSHVAMAVENIFYVDTSSYSLSGPSTMVALDDGLSLAVINRTSKKISRIKHNQLVFQRSIDGFVPFDLLAFNGELYVSSKESGEVKVLSQIDFSLKKTIQMGKSATFMALSSDQSTIYVASPLDHADTIAMINVTTKTLLSPPIYDADLNLVNRLVTRNGKLYVSNQITTNILIFDETAIKNTPAQARSAIYNGGFAPDDIMVTDTHLYLADMYEGKISVINLSTLEKEKDIYFDGQPGRMIFDGMETIYILNCDRTGKVFQLDTQTNEFDNESCFLSGECFYTGSNPEDAVISRDGKVLYVSNYRDDTITYHFILGKLFIEPRTLIVKPIEGLSDPSNIDSVDIETNGILLKAGGGSGTYQWTSPDGGILSTETGETTRFLPIAGEDIYTVTVTDPATSATATSQIIVADIRVTPEQVTVPSTAPILFDITGGTPPYVVKALQAGLTDYVQHDPGETYFQFTPPEEKGVYTVEINDQNGAIAYATVTMAAIPRPKEASRAAIVIAAGAPDPNQNSIWPQIKLTTEFIYKMLTGTNGEGFEIPENQVYLLSAASLYGIPDTSIRNILKNEDGTTIPLTVKDVETAFNWAMQLTDLDQPLLVFLLGHGVEDLFYLHYGDTIRNQLSASTLDRELDRFQETTGNEVVVVMDSCYSGSFIDDLSGEKRAIITSTGNRKAYYIKEGESTIHSFSYKFAKKLKTSAPFKDIYKIVCEELNNFYSSRLCTEKEYIFQNPQFDDNGDGLAFDLLMEQESDDGAILETICMQLPDSLERNSSEKLRNISDKSASLFLISSKEIDNNLTSEPIHQTLSVVSMNSEKKERELIKSEPITLKAKTGVAKGTVNQVYAIVKPPEMTLDLNNDPEEIPYLAYPRIPLQKTIDTNMESANSAIWETKWNEAVYRGYYEVTFMALTENGEVAFSDGICLSVYNAPEPPDASSIDILMGEETLEDEPALQEQKIFSPGDRLRISVVEHLSWGYDLYCAMSLPDGTFFFITGFNAETGLPFPTSEFVKWEDERKQETALELIDIEFLMDFPKGTYTVYAALSPQTVSTSVEKWILSSRTFILGK